MELVPAKKQKTGILAVSGNAGQVAGYVSTKCMACSSSYESKNV